MFNNCSNGVQTKLGERDFMASKSIMDRFLETLRNNKSNWQNDKAFAKIIKKLEEGKDLNKEEFSKIYWLLWKIGRCSR